MTIEDVVSSKIYNDYYDISNTITTAGATNPNDFDSQVYNREQISTNLGRNSEKLLVSNDGTDTLFLVVSHMGGLSFSAEVPLYVGESKTYYNVNEIRLRSPTQGNAYRVMEYELNPNFMSNKQFIPALLYIPTESCALVECSISINS